jgi:hypothetical protein
MFAAFGAGDEAVEQPADRVGVSQFIGIRIHVTQIFRNDEEVFQFFQRSFGSVVKADLILKPAAFEAFGNIRRNGKSCAAHLGYQSKFLIIREFPGDVIDTKHQLVRLLPNLQVGKLLHTYIPCSLFLTPYSLLLTPNALLLIPRFLDILHAIDIFEVLVLCP